MYQIHTQFGKHRFGKWLGNLPQSCLDLKNHHERVCNELSSFIANENMILNFSYLTLYTLYFFILFDFVNYSRTMCVSSETWTLHSTLRCLRDSTACLLGWCLYIYFCHEALSHVLHPSQVQQSIRWVCTRRLVGHLRSVHWCTGLLWRSVEGLTAKSIMVSSGVRQRSVLKIFISTCPKDSRIFGGIEEVY